MTTAALGSRIVLLSFLATAGVGMFTPAPVLAQTGRRVVRCCPHCGRQHCVQCCPPSRPNVQPGRLPNQPAPVVPSTPYGGRGAPTPAPVTPATPSFGDPLQTPAPVVPDATNPGAPGTGATDTPGLAPPTLPQGDTGAAPSAPNSVNDLQDTSSAATQPALDQLAGGPGGAGFGAEGVSGGLRGTPGMIADNFGGGGSVAIVPVVTAFNFSARGDILSGMPGSPVANLGFETTMGPANDFFSVGVGRDTNGDGFADQFSVSEPLPGADSPLPASPNAIFVGGEANNPSGTFADGDTWDVNYAFGEFTEIVLPVGGSGGGNVAVGRQKLAENTSPIPRDRVMFNYSGFSGVPLLGKRRDGQPLHDGFRKDLPWRQRFLRVPSSVGRNGLQRYSAGRLDRDFQHRTRRPDDDA